MSKTVTLTRNKVALISEEDSENLLSKKWHFTQVGYAARRQRKSEGGYNRIIYMHREIMNVIDSLLEVDHINGDRLDNRRCNLRVVTHQQNMLNWDNRRGSSKYRGVSWDAPRNAWKAQIQLDNKNMFIGRYQTELEAAQAYDNQAMLLFKELARCNLKGVA